MLPGSVTLVDGFLPQTLYGRLNFALQNIPFLFGAKSNSSTDSHGHWQKNFTGEGRFNLADVAEAVGSPENPKELLDVYEALRRHGLNNHVLIRCYLNAYTYGTDGYFHRDSDRSDDVTAIIYAVENWHPDWSGETVFLDGNGEIEKSVIPKRNRCVIFPGNISHAARSVSRRCTSLRMTLIFKFRKRVSPQIEFLSDFLKRVGATCYQHQRGTLHDHLFRTSRLLADRGYPLSVCFAGGLHSVYGTKYYKVRLLQFSDKSIIKKAFGEEVENLVRLFSLIDPVETFSPSANDVGIYRLICRDNKRILQVNESTFQSLKAIASANLADQGNLDCFPQLAADWRVR